MTIFHKHTQQLDNTFMTRTVTPHKDRISGTIPAQERLGRIPSGNERKLSIFEASTSTAIFQGAKVGPGRIAQSRKASGSQGVHSALPQQNMSDHNMNKDSLGHYSQPDSRRPTVLAITRILSRGIQLEKALNNRCAVIVVLQYLRREVRTIRASCQRSKPP